MSQEYYVYPKNKVTSSQIKADVASGKISGLTLYKGAEKPQAGEFYIDDASGNTLGVFKDDGVTFIEYGQSYNDAAGIIKRLLDHYKVKVKLEGEGDELFSARDFGDDGDVDVSGNGKFNAVPLDFENVFKKGTWSPVRKRKRNLSYSRVSQIRRK